MRLRPKPTLALLLAGFHLLAVTSLAAKGKSDPFGKAVADLQDSPDDLDLRHKVIRLAQDMDSPPPVPDEVLVLKGKAAYVVKNANSPADFQGAVDAYKRATLLAPWVGDLYYNKGVMEEKAEMPAQAAADFKLYLYAKPEAQDKEKVLERLGKLEVMQDAKKQQVQQAVAQQQRVAVNSVAHQKWESQKTGSVVVMLLGGIGLGIGALVWGLGLGDESSSLYTTSPGYSNGVLYNKSYEGKYWSKDSYDTYTTGEGEVSTGVVVGCIGLGVFIVGAIMSPGPEPTALLNVNGPKLALGIPPIELGPHNGLRTELMHVSF